MFASTQARSLGWWTILAVALAPTAWAQTAADSGTGTPNAAPRQRKPKVASPAAPGDSPMTTAPAARQAAPRAAPQATAPAPPAPASPKPQVTAVQVVRTGESTQAILDNPVTARTHIALGDSLLVRVTGLASLVEASRQPDNPLSLYLDGNLMRGVDVSPEPGFEDVVRLRLERNGTEGNKKAWVKLLGYPKASQWPIYLTVGTQDGTKVAKPRPVTIHLFQSQVSGVLFVVIALLILAAIWIATKTPVLRDSGRQREDGRPAAFSLARTQMALWSFAVLIAFLLIWAVTGSTDSLTPSLLALMGIGSGTALGSAFVDGTKRAQAARDYAGLEGKERTLHAQLQARRTSLGALHAADPLLATARTQLQRDIQDGEARLAQLAVEKAGKSPDTEVVASDTFVTDLLTDDDGYSLHRVQMAGWTLVLFILFWVAVYRDLAMPDFDGTLLALMGISAGTYLGFKLPEKQTPQPPAKPAPATAPATAPAPVALPTGDEP